MSKASIRVSSFFLSVQLSQPYGAAGSGSGLASAMVVFGGKVSAGVEIAHTLSPRLQKKESKRLMS